jgi:MFS family permease
MIIGIQSLGQLLPPLAAAHRIEHLKTKKRYVLILALLGERLPILLIAIAVFTINNGDLLLAIFFFLWAVNNVSTGFNMPAFMALLAKAIRKNQRGRVIGAGTGVGTLLAAAGALLAKYLLENSPGLEGYGWCFFIGFAVLLVSVLGLGFVDEPEEEGRKRKIGHYLAEIPVILKSQPNFRRYLFSQMLLQLGYGGSAFITGYAVLSLGMGEGMVALGSSLLMTATAIGSFALGWLGDVKGYKRVFLLGSASSTLLYAVMSFLPPSSLVFLAYFLIGLLISSITVGGNMTMEFCEPERTATYTAIVYTAIAPVRILAPLFLGLVADYLGFPYVFGLICIASALSFFLLAYRITDPRSMKPAAV